MTDSKPSNTFTHNEVTASFRKFNDLADDVLRSDRSTWSDSVQQLFHHCQNDPVMVVVMESIVDYPLEEFTEWVARRWEAGIRAKHTVPFPADEIQLAAYQYLMLKSFIEAYNINLEVNDLLGRVYGRNREPDLGKNVKFINTEIFSKFKRTISYRLQEIISAIADKPVVPREVLIMLQNNGTYIGGNVTAEGSQVVIGGGIISGSINTTNDLKNAFESLEKLLGDVPTSQQEDVKAAFVTIDAGLSGKPVSKSDAVKAIETLDSASDKVAPFCKDVLGKVGTGLTSNLIIQALNFVYTHGPDIAQAAQHLIR